MLGGLNGPGPNTAVPRSSLGPQNTSLRTSGSRWSFSHSRVRQYPKLKEQKENLNPVLLLYCICNIMGVPDKLLVLKETLSEHSDVTLVKMRLWGGTNTHCLLLPNHKHNNSS